MFQHAVLDTGCGRQVMANFNGKSDYIYSIIKFGVPYSQTNPNIDWGEGFAVRSREHGKLYPCREFDTMPFFQKRMNQNLGSLRQVLIHCWLVVAIDRWWFRGYCILFGSNWVYWSSLWIWETAAQHLSATPLKWWWNYCTAFGTIWNH